MLLERPFWVVSHSTEASKSSTDISWTKGQLQGFLSKSLCWNSVVAIKLPLVGHLVEKEVYCRRVPLNKLNFLKELFYVQPQVAACETIFFCVRVKSNSLNGSSRLKVIFAQPCNNVRKTLDVITLCLNNLLGYAVKNTGIVMKLFVLGTFET